MVVACTSSSAAPTSASAAPHDEGTGSARANAARAPTLVGDDRAHGTIVAARIAAAVGDGPATDRPAYARLDERVTLYAVLDVQDGAKITVYSDAPALRLAGRSVRATPLSRAPRAALRWNKIEPAVQTMSNGDGPTFHFEPIDYRATAIDVAGAALAADVHPTLTTDHGHGVGTMRYQLVAQQGARTVASPGVEARRGKGSGGLRDTVMRVSIRRDDTYLGFLTEMYNQPYIWASAGLDGASHQSDRLEGSDCADFIVYGARRMGARIAYAYTGELPKVTRLLAAGARGPDGVYRDRAGVPLAFTRPGDILLFPRHVGALAADRGVPGVLDDQDLMMHTLFDSPKEQALADSGYAGAPVELRRFTQPLRAPR